MDQTIIFRTRLNKVITLHLHLRVNFHQLTDVLSLNNFPLQVINNISVYVLDASEVYEYNYDVLYVPQNKL